MHLTMFMNDGFDSNLALTRLWDQSRTRPAFWIDRIVSKGFKSEQES